MMHRRDFLTASLAGGAALATGCAGRKSQGIDRELAFKMLEDEESLKQSLAEKTRAVFKANRARSSIGLFHMPSAADYRSFFAWDSGWHVMIMAHLYPELAYQELATVFSTQSEDGRIPHEVRLPDYEETDPLRKALVWLVRRQFDDKGRSFFIDPPSYLVAAEVLYRKTGDRRVLHLLPSMEKCAEHLLGPRDLFGDGLVSIVHPWESGTDSAPVFDKPLEININSPAAAAEYALKYLRLIDFCAGLEWDLAKIGKTNRFVFEDVGMNSLAAAGLQSMAALCRAAGAEARAEKWSARARGMVEAMETLMWDERDAFFYPRFDREAPKRSRRRCLTGMTPLITGLVDEEKAGRLIEENLLSPRHFLADWLVPFNSVSELADEKVPLEEMMLWRGHCIWVNMNWMAARAASLYKRPELARRITRSTAVMVASEGFREFYHPGDGHGMGASGFTWPGLVLDMMEEHGLSQAF